MRRLEKNAREYFQKFHTHAQITWTCLLLPWVADKYLAFNMNCIMKYLFIKRVGYINVSKRHFVFLRKSREIVKRHTNSSDIFN